MSTYTDGAMLMQLADKFIDIMHEHGVRRMEVPMIFEFVNQKIDDQPVQEAKDYPDSR